MSFSISAQFITNTGIRVVNTATVVTNGDWVNDATTTMRNDGTIITTDNFINSGILDAASTGGFVLRFAVNKSFTPGGANFGFLIKEGSGVADITGQFSVSDSLAIRGGLIKPVTAADVLTVAETGTVTSAPGSFLDGGNLVRRGTGRLFFPVGKNGIALPITFLNVGGANPAITVRVEDAPVGFTAGAGISALIDFPFVWKTTSTNVSDSSFVEIEYPSAVTGVTDAVVVRKLTGQNRYEGMGARRYANAAGVVTVRSYSRGARGTFSIARGFRGNLRTDSLALVRFFQSTAGSSWTARTNWLTGRVTTWQGITETGGQITAISLAGNRITGPVPEAFADMAALSTVNLSNNQITRFPDVTGSTGITSLNLSNNRLGFGSLLPNVGIPGINFSNQGTIDDNLQARPEVGTDFTVKAITDGVGNQYVWRRNGVVIPGATDSTYRIAAISRSNMGDYVAEITNAGVPGLTLRTGVKNVLAVANISGTVRSGPSLPMNNGVMRLFRVTPVGAYDTVRVQNLTAANGNFIFTGVVLDDYTVLAAPNTTAFPNDLPTYFTNKLFWEEADKIVLNASRNDIDITMGKRPTAPLTGQGVISGFFEEPIGGGRPDEVMRNRRIANASASVRRRTGTGRTSNDRLELVAQLSTNANGEFEFTGLPEGEYLINLQYPGFPMDERSFINIQIGKGLDRRVSVEALVQQNRIVVNKRVITGWEEDEENLFTVYPNPTRASIYVDVHQTMEAGQLEFVMVNARGQRVSSGILPADGLRDYDVSNLPAGIYLMQISRQGKLLGTQRLLILE